ncbi:MAG: hypothetical protein ACYC2H_05275 [Thermoplasmatota archaeon]
MMKERLSRIFLDGYPITLMGDEAVPPLSRIVRAGGKHPDRVDVLYLTSPSDLKGRPVAPDELIDRTVEPTRPIYLRTAARDVRPIYTAHPEPAEVWSPSDSPSSTPKGPMPNIDPVIAQLGQAPNMAPREARPAHEEAVFRSPSSTVPPRAPQTESSAGGNPGQAIGIEDLAAAEAEAEQRQEDERNQEDALQDEQEELADADDDADTRSY